MVLNSTTHSETPAENVAKVDRTACNDHLKYKVIRVNLKTGQTGTNTNERQEVKAAQIARFNPSLPKSESRKETNGNLGSKPKN